jgi:hypothetical protein
MDNFDLRKYLAEGRLFEEENPVWTIDSTEDSADIEQAGSAYKKAVVAIIKAKHSNISSEDLEKSIEVTNDYWYDESRQNAKGSDPEDIKVSAEEFADSAIEYYEDALMPGEDLASDDDGDKSPKPFDEYLKLFNYNYLKGKYRTAFLNYAEKVIKPKHDNRSLNWSSLEDREASVAISREIDDVISMLSSKYHLDAELGNTTIQ